MDKKVVGNIVELPVDQIKVQKNRYRTDMGDIEDLAQSIKAWGQFVPIIVSEDLTLIAGERRLRAVKHLGLPTIRAEIQPRNQVESRIYEILENLERKEFTWQEQVLAIDDLHRMMSAIKGSGWSARKTAEEVKLSKSGICTDLGLAEVLKTDPEMFAGCDSKKKALKILQKYKTDETYAEIALRRSKTDYGKNAKNHVFLGDCLKLIDKLPANSVNAVISDPFFGVDIDATKKNKGVSTVYDDSEELYKSTMSQLIQKLPRVMTSDSWIVLFCAIQHYPWLNLQLEEAGFVPDFAPAIWYKTATSGQSNRPDIYFGRVYEPFVYARRGDATLVKPGVSNVLQFSVIHNEEKDHPVQKPIALMEEIISRFCLPGHIILDPMCGSGSTLVAAIKRGCNPIGFELEERYYNIAISAVAEALKLKDAGKLDLMQRR